MKINFYKRLLIAQGIVLLIVIAAAGTVAGSYLWNQIKEADTLASAVPPANETIGLFEVTVSQNDVPKLRRAKWVRGTLKTDGKTFRIKVQRLEKSRWEIEFDSRRYYQRLNRLSLSSKIETIPGTTQLVHTLSQYTNLHSRQAKSVNLKTNGHDLGFFLATEALDAKFSERRQLVPGEYFARKSCQDGQTLMPACFETTINDKTKSPAYRERFRKFLAFVRDADDTVFQTALSNHLNIKKYAEWLAVTSLFGFSKKTVDTWRYDPTEGTFEPILIPTTIAALSAQNSKNLSALAARVESHPAVHLAATKALHRLMTEFHDGDAQLRQHYANLRPGISTKERKIWGVDRTVSIAAKNLKMNRRLLKESLSTAEVYVTQVQQEAGRVLFEFAPHTEGQLAIERIDLRFQTPPTAKALRARLIHKKKTVLTGLCPIQKKRALCKLKNARIWSRTPRPERWRLVLSPIQGTLATLSRPAEVGFQQAHSKKKLPKANVHTLFTYRQKPGIKTSPLPFQKTAKRWALPKGRYSLTHSFTIPRGVALKLQPGVDIQMGPSTSLKVQGPLIAVGTPKNPIQVSPLDPKKPWGAIAITHAKSLSRLAHVHIQGGVGAQINGQFFPAQVNLVRSDINIQKTTIAGGRTGISMNRGRVFAIQSQFLENTNHGVEAKKITGTFRECFFEKNGRDGLKLANSKVDVTDSHFTHMAQGGIRAGASSQLKISKTVLSENRLGVTSEDLSKVNVVDSLFIKNRTAIDLGHRSALFGPASAKILNSQFEKNHTRVSKDETSTVDIQGS